MGGGYSVLSVLCTGTGSSPYCFLLPGRTSSSFPLKPLYVGWDKKKTLLTPIMIISQKQNLGPQRPSHVPSICWPPGVNPVNPAHAHTNKMFHCFIAGLAEWGCGGTTSRGPENLWLCF